MLNNKIIGINHGGGSATEWTHTKIHKKSKPRCPTNEQWLKLKKLLSMNDEFDEIVKHLNNKKGEYKDYYLKEK